MRRLEGEIWAIAVVFTLSIAAIITSLAVTAY